MPDQFGTFAFEELRSTSQYQTAVKPAESNDHEVAFLFVWAGATADPVLTRAESGRGHHSENSQTFL